METKELVQAICKALSERKGSQITIIDVQGKTILCDYFVIANGHSSTQVKALTDNVDYALGKLGREPLRKEGTTEGKWAALDYGDVIVHIFNDESRLFYNLERLWADGQNVTYYEDEE